MWCVGVKNAQKPYIVLFFLIIYYLLVSGQALRRRSRVVSGPWGLTISDLSRHLYLHKDDWCSVYPMKAQFSATLCTVIHVRGPDAPQGFSRAPLAAARCHRVAAKLPTSSSICLISTKSALAAAAPTHTHTHSHAKTYLSVVPMNFVWPQERHAILTLTGLIFSGFISVYY